MPHIHILNASKPQSVDAIHMHVHCLHTQQGMKLHRTPPRAMYDAIPVRSRASKRRHP